MPKLVISKISRSSLNRLEACAAEQSTSAEMEARIILERALAPNLADVAAKLFGRKNGVILEIPPRHSLVSGRYRP